MIRSRILAPLLAAVVVALAPVDLAPVAQGQEIDCHCNCYFGFDCEEGTFCNWGDDLFSEDSCWWRTPKPNGAIGAGCDQDYDAQGKCDGICTPLSGAAAVVGGESRANLVLGVATWAEAMTDTSLRGGGLLSRTWLERVDAIEFANPTMAYGLWRLVIEVMILGRGSSYVTFPDEGDFAHGDVAVADLRGRPAPHDNGDAVVSALLAEIAEPGSGRAILDRIDIDALDRDLYARICSHGDVRECLYRHVLDMAHVLAAGAGEGEADGGETFGEAAPSCPGCVGDVVPDDEVNFHDLLDLLSHWDVDGYLPADLNGDHRVGFADLTILLSVWGVCAPPA